MTLAELITYCRDLTGLYSTDLLPDTLVTKWLNESYSELNREQDWPWVVFNATGTASTGATEITLTSGSGRIKEFAIKYSNGTIEQIVDRRALIQTDDEDDGYTYDFDTTTDKLILSKPLTGNVTWYATYMKDVSALASSSKASAIPAEFEGILSYRTAYKMLMSQGDDSKRTAFLMQEYMVMKETLRTELIVDEDIGPFQIGGSALRVDGRTVGRLNGRYRSV